MHSTKLLKHYLMHFKDLNLYNSHLLSTTNQVKHCKIVMPWQLKR